MATLTATNPTLMDLANVTDPDGQIAAVAEILNETNEVLSDMTFIEGNLQTGHKTTMRSGIPLPTWRKINAGVPTSKSTSVSITSTCGMLEAYAEIDKKLWQLNGNGAEFRLSEDRAHIEGMNQTMADTLFYGNEGTEPEAFTGFAPYFNDLSAENADNVIDAGGTGTDNASIWLTVWSPNTVHGIVPKGMQAGLQVTDLGEVTLEDANGGKYQGLRSHYEWNAGLVVRDWRYVVRIANIDKSLLSRVYTAGNFATGAHLPDLMFQALRRIPNLGMGRPAFYASRDIATWIGRQTSAATQGSVLTSENVGGRFVESFMGVPLRRVDAISADEARVV